MASVGAGAAGGPRCSSCGAWGKGVVQPASGMCGHCTRTKAGSVTFAADTAAPAAKRVRDEDEARASASAAAEDAAAKRARGLGDRAHLAQLLAEADKADVPSLDVTGVKKMLLSLEKRINANQLQRAKYADEPARFMESELALDEELKKMRVLASAPSMYPVLVQSDSLKSVLGLLAHENIDIASDVVVLLEELTDEDSLAEAAEAAQKAGGPNPARALVDAIQAEGGLELLVDVLLRMEGTGAGAGAGAGGAGAAGEVEEEGQGIYSSLSLFQNLLAIKPSLAPALCDAGAGSSSSSSSGCSPSRLFDFLFRRSGAKSFDATKSGACELLAILVQSDPAVPERLGNTRFRLHAGAGAGSVDGIEMLLEAVAVYKKRAPEGGEEQEAAMNLFGALCACLLEPGNQARFRAAEGFELMLRMMHEAGFARFPALKVLSYAVTNCGQNCEALVAAGGLPELFPAFMGKGLGHTRKLHGSDAARLEQEYAVSIVAACAQFLPEQATNAGAGAGSAAAAAALPGVQRLRFLSKFKEGRYEKIDRLIELHRKLAAKVAAAEKQALAELEEEGEEDEDVAKELVYYKKVDAGLHALQRICLIAARLVCGGSSGSSASGSTGAAAAAALDTDIAFTARAKLYEQGLSLLDVMDTLEEYAERLQADNAASKTEVAALGALLEQLQTAAGFAEGAGGAEGAAAAAAAGGQAE